MSNKDFKIRRNVASLFAELPPEPSVAPLPPTLPAEVAPEARDGAVAVVDLPIGDIQHDVVQVRYLVGLDDLRHRADAGSRWAAQQLTELTELGTHLQTHGQIQPIRVFRTTRGRPYQVLVGHRRLLAAELAGMQTIQAIVEPREPDELTKLDLQLGENLQRRNLNDMERARVIERYRGALGRQGRPRTDAPAPPVSDETIAQHLGMKPDRMRQLLRLTRFARAAQDRIIEESWSETVLRPLHQAVDRLKLDDATQLAALDALAVRAATAGGTLTNTVVVEYVRQLEQSHRTARPTSWVVREVRHLADASRDIIRLREQFSTGQAIPDDERDTLRAALNNLQHELEQTRRQLFGVQQP